MGGGIIPIAGFCWYISGTSMSWIWGSIFSQWSGRSTLVADSQGSTAMGVEPQHDAGGLAKFLNDGGIIPKKARPGDFDLGDILVYLSHPAELLALDGNQRFWDNPILRSARCSVFGFMTWAITGVYPMMGIGRWGSKKNTSGLQGIKVQTIDGDFCDAGMGQTHQWNTAELIILVFQTIHLRGTQF